VLHLSLKSNSLRTKLSVVLIGLTVVPLILVTTVTILRAQELQRENIIIHDRHTAQVAAGKIETFLVSQFVTLKNIGLSSPGLITDQITQEAFVEQFLHKGGEFSELTLVDATGQEIVRKNTLEVVAQDDLADRSQTPEFLSTQQTGHYISSQYLRNGKPFFLIGEEIRGSDDSFQGAVLAEVDARVLQNVVKQAGQDQRRAYIVNNKGIVVAHPDISQVLLQSDFSSIPAVQRAISPKQEDNSLNTYTNDIGDRVLGDGFPIIASFPENPEHIQIHPDWIIIVEQPASIGLASIVQLTQFAVLTLLIILGISIGAAVLFGRSIAQPIRELQKGAKQIGLGNFDYTFQINTNDELEDLASEFDKMRLRLKQVRQREENLSKLKSEFVSIVAHQLRTPLSALKWAIALFEEEKLNMSKDQKELIHKMTGSNERMIRLVNDLLDAARIEEGRFVYNRTQTTFEEIVQSVLGAIKQKSNHKNVTVTFQEPREPLPQVFIDRDAMELALQNLAENAINYSLAKGKVEIRAVRSGANALLVSVSDNGIGISSAEKERIFSKFFRGTNALKLETEGSGLGLFIVKNIVEAHGGKIWFESTKTKGTTFHFTIPLT
jgi:signal transduction histidine kinase